MPITNKEKLGLMDLLEPPILIQVARSVTKNVVDISTPEEALEYILTHSSDCLTLLNKKAITKEILFRYLHRKKISISSDITKAILVNKVIEYWNDTTNLMPEIEAKTEDSTEYPALAESAIGDSNVLSNKHIPTITSIASDQSEFPINLLARKFSEWFFNNYNQHTLKHEDFWQDARLLLQITASDGSDLQDCDSSCSTLETLYETQQRFGFFFNPNLSHSGVQGRMDVHGLVLVLACGTLHTHVDCVGIFECIFGLLRDPFSENNWKTKTIKLMLRSKGAPSIPSLQESDTLREALTLPVPEGDLT
ncbi:uncharacterized protein C3orf38 homolog [Stomoxys calcitrans]|uniref:uncharacterized protein C3orf38 homolog n=1 Tax=Stomoxys calcitrans TaxID=35570 RepID=UPI0027E38648|nr:uncharacterized protein C3orf38 homolog [Stomoxys calcitrans]